MNYIENVWGAEKTDLSKMVFYEMDKFKRHIMNFPRNYKFNPDKIYKKLFERLPAQAQECILEARLHAKPKT